MSASSEGIKSVVPPQERQDQPSILAHIFDVIRRRYLAGTLSVVGGLVLWELVSRYLIANALFLASPTQIAVALYNLAVTGQLWHHMGISAAEFALGYVIASIMGIALGLGMASSVTIKQSDAALGFRPLRHADDRARAAVHSLARHRHLVQVIVVIFLVLFPVTINTEAGLRTTSERLIEMLRSFGATPRQIFLKVSLPSALPFILAGLKLGIGRGLIGVVVAELFGSRAGLGRLISQSADAFNMPELFAGVVILAFAGIVMTAGFGWLEGRLVPWTRD